MKMRNASSQLV